MKTYKEFKEAAALVLPALKAAPYVIPALGAGVNILKGMMQSSMLKSDASDRFKARQRGGRLSPGEVQRRQAREDRRAEAQRRAQENTPKDKPVENVPTSNKPAREKVDPRLERAANQVIDSLRRGNTLSITNRETGLSDSEKKRLADLMDRVKADRKRREVQQPEKDILNYGRQRGIAERPKKVDEGYKDPVRRELKLKGQQIINDKEKYDKGTTPLRGTVRVKKA